MSRWLIQAHDRLVRHVVPAGPGSRTDGSARIRPSNTGSAERRTNPRVTVAKSWWPKAASNQQRQGRQARPLCRWKRVSSGHRSAQLRRKDQPGDVETCAVRTTIVGKFARQFAIRWLPRLTSRGAPTGGLRDPAEFKSRQSTCLSTCFTGSERPPPATCLDIRQQRAADFHGNGILATHELQSTARWAERSNGTCVQV